MYVCVGHNSFIVYSALEMGGKVRLADKKIETKRGNKQTGNTVTKTNKQTNKEAAQLQRTNKYVLKTHHPM